MKEAKQKKIMVGFLIFLLLMWVCTLISKSIYASRLPQVTVLKPEKGRIEHIVESTGIIKQGGEKAVNISKGILVEKLYVRQGDTVEEGSLLFSLDMEDLEEIIAERELQAARLEYQIAQLNENGALIDSEKQREVNRAEEDYERAGEKADKVLERAEEAYRKAASKLEQHLQKEGELASGQITVSGNQVDKQDDSQEDSARKAWEAEKESLEEELKNARYGKEDADRDKEEKLIIAGRASEDAAIPAPVDNTAKIYQLELQAVEKDIKKFRDIYQAEGKVISEGKGTVTGIRLAVGERTPDGAAIVCADNDIPFQFETSITKEQKKYVKQGDTVTLKTTQGKQELIIDYMEEEKNNPGTYRTVVYLPKDTGQLGMDGTLTKNQASQIYENCIPIEALHSANGGKRYYIYLAGEREGILGKEMYVEICYVNVLDQNDKYAALEAGAFAAQANIIIRSDKEIKNGDIIRLKDVTD